MLLGDPDFTHYTHPFQYETYGGFLSHRGTSTSSIFIFGSSVMNHPFLRGIYPILGNLHILNNRWIWVNYNISLTWNKAIKGDDFPKINHDSRVWSQWGRDEIYQDGWSSCQMFHLNRSRNVQGAFLGSELGRAGLPLMGMSASNFWKICRWHVGTYTLWLWLT